MKLALIIIGFLVYEMKNELWKSMSFSGLILKSCSIIFKGIVKWYPVYTSESCHILEMQC